MIICLGTSGKTDPRLQNLFYRKSKLESVNETSALLSGFAIVSNLSRIFLIERCFEGCNRRTIVRFLQRSQFKR